MRKKYKFRKNPKTWCKLIGIQRWYCPCCAPTLAARQLLIRSAKKKLRKQQLKVGFEDYYSND